MTGWIIFGIVAAALIIAACVKISARWSRHEEKEENKSQ